MLLLICVLVCIVVLLVSVHYVLSRPEWTRAKALRDVRRALVVVAHPDDECMFFAPTLLGLTKHSAVPCDVHVLCLSSGNFYKQGARRKHELRSSCQLLGVPAGNITVIEHTRLPDDPQALWSKAIVRDVLLRYIERLAVDTVVTFDAYGVSGHANHRAVFVAMQHLYSKGKLPVGTQVFVLKSVALWRKYTLSADSLVSYFDSTYVYISSYADVWLAQRAMIQYRSQLVWFRILYILFSRYMVVNTLQRISSVW